MDARRTGSGWAFGFLAAAALAAGLVAAPAGAQRARDEPRYEYKIVPFRYNPGERLTDDARARQYERLLNDLARDGWEPVADVLNRSNVQTVGGAVTTRDSVSFVAFRRPR